MKRSQHRPAFLRFRVAHCVVLFLLIMVSIPTASRNAVAQSLTDSPSFPFDRRRPFGSESNFTVSVALGDMNGDGNLDIVTGRSSQQSVVYLNDVKGNFPTTNGRPYGSDKGTEDSILGDVDSDDDLDIIGGNSVYLNDGAGNFSVIQVFGSGEESVAALGDMNGDGYLDIITTRTVYLNDLNGHFPSSNAQPFGDPTLHPQSIAVGDVDNDGDVDIVSGNSNLDGGEQSYVYLNDGTGHFVAGLVFGTGVEDSIALGDMDGNGYLDIVTPQFIYLLDATLFLRMRSQSIQNSIAAVGSLEHISRSRRIEVRSSITQVAPGGLVVVLGDVDSDGDLDIVIGSVEQDIIYLNDGIANFPSSVGFGTGRDATSDVAIGDVDNDGALDIISSNIYQQDVVYLNDGVGRYPDRDARPFGVEADTTISTAVGDMDGDGDLDIVAGNSQYFDETCSCITGGQDFVYLNDGKGGYPIGQRHSFGIGADNTAAVAVGDLDGDGDLDIVVGNGEISNGSASDSDQDWVYVNDGSGNFPLTNRQPLGTPADQTSSVALGDLDSDGDLDIVTGNPGQQSLVYFNDGAGTFPIGNRRPFGSSADADKTILVAVADLDNDGDLDIATAYKLGQNTVYLNDGSGNFPFISRRLFGTGVDNSLALAVGDVDSDGDVDIAVGNYGQQNLVYLNDGAANFPFDNKRIFGTGDDRTSSIAMGDIDGDSDIDLVVGNGSNSDGQQNVAYLNDGSGNFLVQNRRLFGSEGSWTGNISTGDVDGDGDLDVISGNFGQQSAVYINRLADAERLPNTPPRVVVLRPGSTRNANFFSTPQVVTDTIIPISYTLFDQESDTVRTIRVSFSLDGGANWQSAYAAPDTQTANLATAPSGVIHVFAWDTFASGFFGQSDSVVLRITAFPSLKPSRNGVPGPYQRPYAAAVTFPFRVLSTQVRIVAPESSSPAAPPPSLGHTIFLPLFAKYSTLRQNLPIPSLASALVYRLPASQLRGARPLTTSGGQPLYTDYRGYLQGRGELVQGDRLVALLPVLITDTYTLYYTNAVPTTTGLDTAIVKTPGVQTLAVSSNNPLLLFNLNVSLEWDARTDPQFLSQLTFDLKRASEMLYDWTNGQVGIGKVTIFQAKQHWNDAHIRIYATNRMRPNANQGGITSSLRPDPLISAESYTPGQLRIGAVWNRYGEASGTLGEDWPRTLAHELGHYLLYLDDNYIGLDDQGVLIPVTSCTGTAMADPYRDDYSEFHPAADWLPGCAQTLSQQSTGRSDWATIGSFYPWLNTPMGTLASVNSGPSLLPLDVTEVIFAPTDLSSTTVSAPIFLLSRQEDQSSYQPSSSARAILFQRALDGTEEITGVVDLGKPILDRVLARGARPGDRVCVYDPLAERLGCQEHITPTNLQIPLRQVDWHPDVIVTPVTSTTFTLDVLQIPGDVQVVKARIFPTGAPSTPEFALTNAGNGHFTGRIALPQPSFEGLVQLWVEEAVPQREVVTDYSLGGNPGRAWARNAPRGSPGRAWARNAPAISSDGQALIFGRDLQFAEGQFFAFQGTTSISTPPMWATVVGQAYRLTANVSIPPDTSISFSYLQSDVPPGEEPGLEIYFWNSAAQRWEVLPTTVNMAQNNASARLHGPGLYALMSSIKLSLQKGWNQISYPVRESRPVRDALRSIDGFYTTLYTIDPNHPGKWLIFDISQPDNLNTLRNLEPGRGYLIYVTKDVNLRLKGPIGVSAQALHKEVVPNPPTTYYGKLYSSSNFTPTAGMLVIARINGNTCGRGITQIVGEQVMYSVIVDADHPDARGCGLPGYIVRFQVASQDMATTALWGGLPQDLPLSP